MKREFTPEIITDQSTGCRYHTRPLAFKNGVLYIEMMFFDKTNSDSLHRDLAVHVAKHYRKTHSEFNLAIAAKVTILRSEPFPVPLQTESSPKILESIVGIMFREGLLN